MTLRTIGYTTYLGIRALIEDVPEDFLARIEPGLDRETKQGLALGLWAIRLMRRVSRIVLASFLVGTTFLYARFLGGERLGDLPLVLAGLAWSLTVLCLLFQAIVSLAYRKDIRRTLAFARAMRGSSLARDLA
ncbi:MAG TPA: hypothetical protein VJ224_06420 [Thermoplasmata archaeon]|nr:hypothetical protein [Thermoplasmata archaeon]